VLLASVFRNQILVRELARREITDVHAGQGGGVLWVIVHPLSMFIIYGWLFTAVLKVRIGEQGPADYMVYLFAGLAPWLMTQDVLVRSAVVIFTNSTIVKKVMFPIEALVAKSLLAAVKVQSILLLLVAVYAMVVRETVPPIMLLLLPLFCMHLVLLWGLALLLSSITPYFRDTSEFLRVFLLANIYLIPVMYTPAMVPEALQFTLAINPFSHLIWCYQDIIYFNAIEHPSSWVIMAASSCCMLVLGSYVFSRLRSHIPSVV
jgi:lipopolysaccharide transport system permease protein